MKYLKLFEEYVENNFSEYKIHQVFYHINHKNINFTINDHIFSIYPENNINDIIPRFHLLEDDIMIDYIKSQQFVDDLQDELFNKDLYDYSAEEIQYIILKYGILKYSEIFEQYKNLNKFEDIRFNKLIYFGIVKDVPFFRYDPIYNVISLYSRTILTDIENKLHHDDIDKLKIKLKDFLRIEYNLDELKSNKS